MASVSSEKRSLSRGRESMLDSRDHSRKDNNEEKVTRKGRGFNKENRRDRNEKGDISQVDEEPQIIETVDVIKESGLTRSGGAYVPPARLRILQQQQLLNEAPDSEVAQRISWDALKKSINGLINKVNSTNIRAIIPELFSEDLTRGRGLFCRSLMKAQSLALPFTPVYAAVAAVINSKMPMVGETLANRLVYHFRRAYKRNDRTQCLAQLTLLAHLTNQGMIHEILALQVLALLLERPTADSVELAVGMTKECGQFLSEKSPKPFNAVFDRFRDILHEGQIDKRVQYMIEVLFQVRKDNFRENPAIPQELDLLEEDEGICHQISLDDEIDPEDSLNVFKFNPDYLESQEKFNQIKRAILGSDDESGSESDSEEGSEASEEEEEEEKKESGGIIDKTGTNLVNLRRTIYLAVMSSLSFEECAHKLLGMKIAPEDEVEVCSMILECCSQERTYTKFYGNLGERLCKLQKKWAEHFEYVFQDTYSTIHRYETNKLRSIANFFAHLFAYDAIPLPALSVIVLTEEATTASSRIFIKILFQELVAFFGMNTLDQKLKDPELFPAIQGLFPMDTPKNTRFAINYYTSINLGALTKELRDHLNKIIAENAAARAISDDSSDADSSDLDSDSGSDSDSDSGSDSFSSENESKGRVSNNRRSIQRSLSRSKSPKYRRSPYDSRRGSVSLNRMNSVSPRHSNRRSPSYKRDDYYVESRGRSKSPRRRFDRAGNNVHSRSRSRSNIRGSRYGRHDRRKSPSPTMKRKLASPTFARGRRLRNLSRSPSPYRAGRISTHNNYDMKKERRSISRSLSPNPIRRSYQRSSSRPSSPRKVSPPRYRRDLSSPDRRSRYQPRNEVRSRPTSKSPIRRDDIYSNNVLKRKLSTDDESRGRDRKSNLTQTRGYRREVSRSISYSSTNSEEIKDQKPAQPDSYKKRYLPSPSPKR